MVTIIGQTSWLLPLGQAALVLCPPGDVHQPLGETPAQARSSHAKTRPDQLPRHQSVRPSNLVPEFLEFGYQYLPRECMAILWEAHRPAILQSGVALSTTALKTWTS